MNRVRPLAIIALAAAVLAGCSSGGPPAAASLAGKIPHCGSLATNTPPVIAVQDVTCIMPDGSQVELVTFATSADEQQWIASGGSPATPDPQYDGCCLQGTGWAATIGDGGNGTLVDWYDVTKALGGRQVTG